MRFGKLGGALVVGGWLLFLATGVIFAGGGSVSIGGATSGGLVLGAALGLIGVGAALLGIAGPRPLDNRAVRIGLGILAIGFLFSLSSSVIGAGLEYDPMESWSVIILFLLGGAATLLGTIVTVIALLLVRGPSRVIGAFFPIGLGLAILASLVAQATGAAAPFDVIATLVAIVGGACFVAGGIGVGMLPWYVARSSGAAVPA
jgi:hypothetical protein